MKHDSKRQGAGKKPVGGETKPSQRLPALETINDRLDKLNDRLDQFEALVRVSFEELKAYITQSKNSQNDTPPIWHYEQNNIDDYDDVAFDSDYDEVSSVNENSAEPPKPPKIVDGIEISGEFEHAVELMNSGQNVFITGRAGTGKSTLLQYWQKQAEKKVVILAPTGIAALNIGGQTIHSFCGFPPRLFYPDSLNPTSDSKKLKLLEKVDTIVVDEISMVSALLFDGLEAFLRINKGGGMIPFGGCQIILIGDLYQLPPVVSREESKAFYSMYKSPYFFNAKMQMDFNIVELSKIYRQSDVEFINTLNNIRLGQATQTDLILLNSRVKPMPDDGEFCVTLAPTNRAVATINKAKLDAIVGEKVVYEAEINGKFKEKDCPADPFLELKVGAQILMVSNDSKGRWVNGSVGIIIDLPDIDEEFDDDEDEVTITVELDNGEYYEVARLTWEMNEYVFDEKTKKLEFEKVGSCKQFPIRLAWAITCHKSQGLTLQKMNVDLTQGGFFAHGQAYVTLSRAASLEGLYLKKSLKISDLNKNIDNRVKAFFASKFDNSISEGGL
jgi:ATP-dependent exoDNAse (exonuclease V) alpha subunit